MKSFSLIVATVLSIIFSFDNAFSQWTDLNPWNSAKITGIEIIDSTYFVATENGIWRSQDSMQTWQLINQGLPKLRISKLFANDKVAIATIDSVGVFLSKDKGNTWTKSSFNHNNLLFIDIDSDNNFIYLVSYDALYSSSDNGETWSDTLLSGELTDIKCIDNGIYCGIYAKGIYYSSNQGKDWELRNSGIQNFRINSIDGNSKFLLATTEMEIYADIYLSTNKGISWTRLNKDFQNETLFTKPLTTAIVLDSLLFVREISGRILQSTNLGKDWVHRYSTSNMYNFEYKINNNVLYMSTAEKRIMYHSPVDKEANIVDVFIAPHCKYISELHNVENTLLISSNKDISFSNNNGTDMTQNYLNSSNANVFTNKDNIVFAVNRRNSNNITNYNTTFLYSTNKGEVWDTTNFNYEGGDIKFLNYYQDTISAISEYAFAYSTNKGKVWSQTINHKSFNIFLYSKDDVWYFLKMKDTNSIITISMDKGKSFFDLVDVSSLQHLPRLFHNGYSLYLSTRLKVALVTNATNQIIDLTKNLPVIEDTVAINNMFVNSETIFCLLYFNNKKMFKLYYLSDENGLWQEYGNKENAVLGNKLYADDKYLYSFDPRFYRTELSNFKSMSVEIDSQNENPVLISLSQDILSFNLPIELNSNIEIYNSLGKTMHIQYSNDAVDVSNFAKGVYFARIQSNGKTIVNKFVKY